MHTCTDTLINGLDNWTVVVDITTKVIALGLMGDVLKKPHCKNEGLSVFGMQHSLYTVNPRGGWMRSRELYISIGKC